MNARTFELLLTTEEEAQPIRNLWPLYVHEVSEFDGQRPNRHGVISDSDDLRTVADLSPGAWWSRPDCLFPYLIRVDGIAAGFNLIAGGPYAKTDGIDYTVHEFFVAHAFRADGTAVRAAREGIARHRGTWEVVTYPSSPRAIAFWRKTLPPCTTAPVQETEEDHALGRRVVFHFDNRRA